MSIKKIIRLKLLFVCSLLITPLHASMLSKPGANEFINSTAKKYHYSKNYVRSVLSRAKYNPRVIEKIEHPYEAKPWQDYRPLFLTQERLDEGIRYWDRSNKLMAWEEREYSVPASIILAIIGIETKYGKNMGTFKVLDSLATLAFNYPQRATFFKNELAAFIALSKTYRLNPNRIYGSYAGAMGQPQFMPSSYLHYAVDFHGKNQPNLFKDKADVIFSIGNYLRQNGWEVDQPIATPAKVIGNKYQQVLHKNLRKMPPPQLTLGQLAGYGVYPQGNTYDQQFDPNLTATLIRLQGRNGPEFWLTFHNFYVITRYNSSALYAMAVYQLAQHLQAAWDKKNQPKDSTTPSTHQGDERFI